MAATYTILCFRPEGTLHRLTTKPCASLDEAIRHAVAQCANCARFTVYGGGRTLWSGSPAEALAAIRVEQPSCRGGAATLH